MSHRAASSLFFFSFQSPIMHKHMGTGVSFIHNFSQLPSEANLASDTYILCVGMTRPGVSSIFPNIGFHSDLKKVLGWLLGKSR